MVNIRFSNMETIMDVFIRLLEEFKSGNMYHNKYTLERKFDEKTGDWYWELITEESKYVKDVLRKLKESKPK